MTIERRAGPCFGTIETRPPGAIKGGIVFENVPIRAHIFVFSGGAWGMVAAPCR